MLQPSYLALDLSTNQAMDHSSVATKERFPKAEPRAKHRQHLGAPGKCKCLEPFPPLEGGAQPSVF